MKIKIMSTQIYDNHEDKIEENYNDASINILDKNIILKYNKNEIIMDKEKRYITVKSDKNNLFIELKKQNEFNYETPYGNIKMKTIGEKIELIQKPFRLLMEYNISLNDTINYKNIMEIIED